MREYVAITDLVVADQRLAQTGAAAGEWCSTGAATVAGWLCIC